jgi:trimethylamine--corrinoid protein Co-methyltransferase
MRAHTTWLSEAEKSRIVDAAIGLLGRVGMRFAGSGVLPLLAERGADVDMATGLVRFPRELVEWAAGQCPREVVLGGLTDADDVLLGAGEPVHFAPSGCVAKTLDFRSGERRASTLKDVRECTALNDELPELDIMWTQVSASDVPLEARELTEYFTLLTETRKHVTFVDCPTEVDAVLRLCETLAGDLDRFRARPRLSTVVTAASPLQVDGGILDVHVALARHGVPVHIYSMAISGATAPVTLAGTVMQGLAEFLGVATALQVAAPGACLVFCFGSGVLDMRQTTFALGCVESALMAAMATEVGHHVGVPTLSPGFSTDARHISLQDGYEKAMKAATVCAAGTDVVTGWGVVDSHNTMSLPQSVIDNEMGGMLRRLTGPVEVSELTLAAEAFDAVGPGGGFLGRKETAKRIRAGEHYLPTLSSRLSYEKWVEQGTTEYDEACARVEALLAAHAFKEPYMDGALLDEITATCRVDDDAVRRARREGPGEDS